MRIAILGTRGIPANYSGFETCVQETALRFADSGIDVWVYCRKGRVGKASLERENMHLVFLPYFRGKHSETISHTFFSVVHVAFHPVDTVHLYGAGNGWFAPLLRMLGLRVLFLVDGLDWERAKWSRGAKIFLRWGGKVGSRWAHKTIGDSRHVNKSLRKTFDGRAVEYVPYGAKVLHIDGRTMLSKLNLRDKEYFLFVGRFVPEKNVLLLVNAFTKTSTSKKLVLVGGNSYDQEYENTVRSCGDERVIFPGFVFGAEYEELLSGCYVYIQPSALEGTSPSLLAAMGAGACVLVSDIEENKETVGNAGFYFRSNDESDLIAKIALLDKSNASVERARRSSLERVQATYNWNIVAQQLLSLSSSGAPSEEKQ